jgi:2-methylcitrate dehydratase
VDDVARRIVDFVDGLDSGALNAAVIHEAKRRLVDSFGCMVGGLDSQPAAIARRLAGQAPDGLSATAAGLPAKTTIEMAAFANTVMVRYLDYNDMYFTPRGGGQHPSDLIPVALATGEALRSSGVDVLLSVVIAYEIGAALAGVARIRERGWDQGTFIAAAGAMSAGKLLGLSRDQLGHALAIAVTSNIATRQTRVGALSMWKGCATAAANRNGIFAALLAREGMTGPAEPFVGKDGIMERVTGPFTLDLPLPPTGSFVVQRSGLKFYAAEYNSHGALDLVLALRHRIPLDQLKSIHVETYWVAYSEIGMEVAKWRPHTRETADHSLPYLLAVALADGRVTPESFTERRIFDPALRPLMECVTVAERKEFSERFPRELNTRLIVRLGSGETIEAETAYPHGHARDPLTDDEIKDKCERLFASTTDPGFCRETMEALWRLEAVDDVGEIFGQFGRIRTR